MNMSINWWHEESKFCCQCCFIGMHLLDVNGQGRVSRCNDKGVMVDVGAHTEQGEWVDGYLHVGQIRDDGGYVPLATRTMKPFGCVCWAFG